MPIETQKHVINEALYINIFIAVISLVWFLVCMGWMVFAASKERDAFNKCTGSHATLSDAYFTELRVEKCNE